MKKILSLGLILGLCGSLMVGCGKMSREDIDEYGRQEDSINYNLNNASETLDNIILYSSLIWGIDDQKRIDEFCKKLTNYQKEINELTKDLNKISLDELSKFHDYMVEYKGTTQEEEDIKFMVIKYNFLLAKTKLAFADKIMNLYKDGSLSYEDNEEIKMIESISDDPSYKISDDEAKKIRQELDKDYFLDSKELLELYNKLTNINKGELDG